VQESVCKVYKQLKKNELTFKINSMKTESEKNALELAKRVFEHFTATPAPGSLNISGNSGISMGESNQANGFWHNLDGKIDNVRIYDRALILSEISALYNEEATPVKIHN
jgi:hypothetical protein